MPSARRPSSQGHTYNNRLIIPHTAPPMRRLTSIRSIGKQNNNQFIFLKYMYTLALKSSSNVVVLIESEMGMRILCDRGFES